MNEIERAIKAIESRKWEHELFGDHYHFFELAIQALQEKAEREERMQWLDDMDNPLEPIKVQTALESELLKYNYRKENKPKDISILDITIIYALNKILEDGLKGSAE